MSAVAIPASLVLAFLGINTSQVSTRPSMFSHQYLGIYLTSAAVIALGVILPWPCTCSQRRDARRHPAASARSRWTLAADDTHN